MNIHIPSKALRVTAKSIAFAGPDAAPARRRNTEFTSSTSALTALLDKAIGLLMTAIVLTLAWPVGMAVWGQSHSAHDAHRICRSMSDALTTPNRPMRCNEPARAA